MDYFLNNIASLALIPLVVAMVLKLKGAQIDSLKQQNETLKSHVSYLDKLRPSEIEKDYEAVKKFADKKTKELQNANEELGKLRTKIEQKEQLNKKDIDFVSSVVGLTQEGLSYYASGPTFWHEYRKDLEKKRGRDIYPLQRHENKNS